MFSKLRSNIAFQIILGIFLIMTILANLIAYIGYLEFTESIEDIYADNAYGLAIAARNFLPPNFVTECDYDSPKWKKEALFIRTEWRKLVMAHEASYIYIFKASGKNYEDVEFLIDAINVSLFSDEYESGHTIKQHDTRYLNAFEKIYDDKDSKVDIVVYRPENDEFPSGNHITTMIPLKNSAGDIVAVLGVERSMDALDDARYSYLKRVAHISVICGLIVILLSLLYINRKIIVPIQLISHETSRFARENTLLPPEQSLSANIRIKNDLGRLAHSIDRMEIETTDYIDNLTRVTQEKEQIKAELNVATQIQANMLPKDFVIPGHNEFELFASMTPAKEVGGDFYDFFMIDEDHLALVMADVSGKGVPAALFMVIAKTLIKNRAQMGGSPNDILYDVNNNLYEGNEASYFVTTWLGILELSTGKVLASNAGHEYPAIKHKNGKYELFESKNSPAIAVMSGMKFRLSEFTLERGDYLYLYTDGVPEATNSNDELFGLERMIDELNKTEGFTVEDTSHFMKKAVDDFTGDAPQFDDMTMLCLKYFGKRD